ncbi:MAG: chorismate mutase [Actinomycetaceae bacterium]|nr:chorismate mutase [Actinomycetaceae bacterium]
MPEPAQAATTTETPRVPVELEGYRRTIDNLDSALVHILAERFRCTQQVGYLKAERGLPASDRAREARQIARLRQLAEESGLDPVFAEKFLKFIVAEVIRHHQEIAAEHDADEDRSAGAQP